MYAELVGVIERAAGRLQLPWLLVGGEIARDESSFSPVIEPPVQVSLSFLCQRTWKNPYSACTSATNISGLVSLFGKFREVKARSAVSRTFI